MAKTVETDIETTQVAAAPATARKVSRSAVFVTYGMPLGLVAAMFAVLIPVQANAEAAVADVAGGLPIGFAVAAGIVASVNPCGFFMLPSYIAFQLGTEEAGYDQRAAVSRVWRALLVGLMATLGFVLIFGAVGAIIAAGGNFLSTVFPFLGLGIGVLMIGFGAYLLVTHRYFGILAASRVPVTPRRNLRNAFVFGLGYAVGSLSCTLPIFLVVVGGALATQGFFQSLGQFVAYAVGMGFVVIAVTIGAALFRDAVSHWLRSALPHVHRASSFFMLGAGAYLIYYWVFFAGLNLPV